LHIEAGHSFISRVNFPAVLGIDY